MATWNEWLTQKNLHNLVQLPDSVLASAWQPTEEDRNAAWDLYTELRTRITTQPLHYRAGDEATAVKSVCDLFDVTRKLLREHKRKCGHFAIFAVFMLNGPIRPFTAKWHKVKEAGRLGNEDVRRDFRRELLGLQEKLRLFQRLLGHLAEGDSFKENSETGFPAAAPVTVALGADVTVPPRLDANIWQREREYILQRRRTVLDQQDPDATNLVGLAISGGGIRSATFALGVVQRLAKAGLLAQVDYLSTVSGGGYLGSFLSSYLDCQSDLVGAKAGQLPFRLVDQTEAPPVRHLREHSKYLLEGNWFQHLRLMGQAAYGILTNLLILVPLLVLLAIATAELRGRQITQALRDEFSGQFHDLTVAILFILLVFVLLLAVMQNLGRYGPRLGAWRDRYEQATALVLLIALLAVGIELLPALFAGYAWLLGQTFA
jgi:hypothetical protein